MTVQLLVNSAETIPLKTRLAWLQEEHPTANIVAEIVDAEVDLDSPTAWDDHMKVIERLLPSRSMRRSRATRTGPNWRAASARHGCRSTRAGS
ncbi:hypothetical protein [uncultured Amnibacterium sp.]|uniref:hypothetical protein n=1 Tax=uncultured Amnibacterium sp. TaxID=1631851 RepID=UPI0035CA80A5